MPSVTGVAPPKKILVAVDGSDSSYKAVDYALMLAPLLGSEITIINVMFLPGYFSQETQALLREEQSLKGNEILSKAMKMGEGKRVALNSKLFETSSSIISAIVDFADSLKADMIVLGTRGTTPGIPKLALGSVALGVVSFANCPVTVVK